MLRAIFFDLDNTLADRDAVFHRYRTEAGESRVPDLPDTTSAEMVRASNDASNRRVRRCVADLYEPDPALPTSMA